MVTRPGGAILFAAVLVAASPTTPLWGQDNERRGSAAASGEGLVPAGSASYLDPTARALHESAMERRAAFDDQILEYTAVVRQRIGAALRTPLKDRTVYRMEAAHRLFWSRDSENVVQVLALRQQTPAGVELEDVELGFFDESFDPLDDRLLFGLGDESDDFGDPDTDDFWFEHPLYPEYVEAYHFSTGDTLRLSLPDGRAVLAVELQVVPKVADVHRMAGSLWVEPTTGSLVRAVYRLADTFDAFRDIPELREEEDDDLRFVPGIFKPWTAEISLIAVDYSLWDFDVWLPRSMRMEGLVTAGILKAPATFDLSYEIEAVTTERSLEEAQDEDIPVVHFETRSEAMAYLNRLAFGDDVPYRVDERTRWEGDERVRYVVPSDPVFLAESPELPPPVWEDAPGFASDEQISELFDGLADLPIPPVAQVPASLRWGLQRPDLVRYNRVEALSIGARGQLRPQTFLGPLSVTASGRLGVGDLHPNARVDVVRETLRRRLTLSGYHELAAIDEEARHLGLGNSLNGLFFGRDDGDYYRRSGVSLEWTPPSSARRTVQLRTYAERHRAVANETDFALFRFWNDGFSFRPNVAAEEGWEYGGLLRVAPWWGTDPNLAQGGLELTAQGGVGDVEYGKVTGVARVAVPLPSDLRVGVELGAGTSWGAPPPQRLFYVGGSRTLRGYDPRVLGGTSFGRGRLEVARGFPVGAVSLFSDIGWAGAAEAFDLDDARYSVGAGLSILDGLIRMDAAYGLRAPRGFRLDFYLDALM